MCFFQQPVLMQADILSQDWFLWMPEMIFNAKPHTWSYLKEGIEISLSTQQRQGSFKLTSSIKKPRHVFIWALNDNKLNDQRENMFLFNTHNIADGQTITYAQLELSNGVFYPREIMNPTVEIAKTYRTLMFIQKDSLIISQDPLLI